jgi:hypothetical protein
MEVSTAFPMTGRSTLMIHGVATSLCECENQCYKLSRLNFDTQRAVRSDKVVCSQRFIIKRAFWIVNLFHHDDRVRVRSPKFRYARTKDSTKFVMQGFLKYVSLILSFKEKITTHLRHIVNVVAKVFVPINREMDEGCSFKFDSARILT